MLGFCITFVVSVHKIVFIEQNGSPESDLLCIITYALSCLALILVLSARFLCILLYNAARRNWIKHVALVKAFSLLLKNLSIWNPYLYSILNHHASSKLVNWLYFLPDLLLYPKWLPFLSSPTMMPWPSDTPPSLKSQSQLPSLQCYFCETVNSRISIMLHVGED